MLRVILATLGVALIAFGLFGGKSLEQVYAGLNGAFDKFNAGDSSHGLVAESTAVDSGTDEQLAQAETEVAVNAVNSDVANTAADSVVASEQSSNLSQQQNAAELVVAETATEVGGEERKLSIASVQQVNDDEGALASSAIENAAEATASEDDSGAVKEVKASARNEELELALGTADSEESELPKEADVGEILQTTTGANNAEALFVLKDLVNMRQGPSIEHPVVLRLEKGQELMEFKRDGKWVHVGAYGTSGKIGWVHERLVGKTPG